MIASSVKIIAFDPGVTTGWARHIMEEQIRPPREVIPQIGLRAWDGGQFSPNGDDVRVIGEGDKRENGHHLRLYRFLSDERPDVVVCERFVYEIRRHAGNDVPGIVLMSRDYIGIIELWCKVTRTPLMMQTRSPLKLWDDEKLKKLELYAAGEPHRVDATRHLLHYLVTHLKRRDYILPLKGD